MSSSTRRSLTLTALLAALSLAACGDRRGPPAAGSAAPAPSRAAAPAAPAAAPGSAAETAATPAPPDAPEPSAIAVVPADARQLVLALIEDWDDTRAELSRWERDDHGAWRAVGKPWRGVIGRGAAWGRGLHGEGPPAGAAGETKREGDGKSPAGVFALRGSYGYAKAPPSGARWPYTPVDARWSCVDDSASRSYGQIVDTSELTPDWSSSEAMRRRDALYTWVVDVAHNPERVQGGGSCIFLHVWRSADAATVGCTAMARRDLEEVLRWLAPDAKPVFALLPRRVHAERHEAWKLPAAP
ncbi:MAG: L,D-transpeptidase family protein [Kofleriaceae bacterium]